MTKHLLRSAWLILLSIGFSICALAQSPPSNLDGEALKSWLRTNHYDNQYIQHSYSKARMYMYNFIDNKNNSITGVYSGYVKSWTYGGSGTNPSPINCEHTIPQSLFSSAYPMQSDLHHLFPTYQNWNSMRSNFPLGEIPDAQTTKWIINTSSQTSIPTSNIDAYSESDSGIFEPREEHKGNAARAIFYFFTMYPTQAGDISQVANVDELYAWHLADPVNSQDVQRNNAIAYYQGNKNPFIDQPELIARAWNLTGTPPPPPPPPPTGTETTELLISEYVEGNSSNKAIEIANFTGATVDLSEYELGKQTNGAGAWIKDIPLSGSLAHGEIFVVAHSSATSGLASKADLLSADWTISFNGNDPIALLKNGVIVDIVGTMNGGSADFGKDVTLVRNFNITNPSTNFDASEWDVYAANTFSYLGLHEMATPVTPPAGGDDLIFSEYIEGSSYNKALEIANLTSETIDLSAYEVKKQSNGAGAWTSGISLNGTLASGAVFVLAHASSDAAILAESDYTGTNSELSFNGNDPIGLFKNGTLIDIIGVFDSNIEFAKNTTITRLPSVSNPISNFDNKEWESHASNTFEFLGKHGANEPTSKELLFSEYVEGSSYNKVLEIANLGSESVDLSPYEVRKQSNGAGAWSNGISLSGSLQGGDVFVLAHSSSDVSLLAQADYTSAGSALTFNGNDAVGLFKDDVLIDIIGIFDSGAAYFAKDVTLVRNTETLNPNTSYTVSEWTTSTKNTFTGIGSHNAAPAARLFLEEIEEVTSSDLAVSVFPNPVREQLQIQFSLEKETYMTISILDLTGRTVALVNANYLSEGMQSFQFNTNSLAPGFYLVGLESQAGFKVEKFLKN